MSKKLKTHKGTTKRFWKSGSGKLRRLHAMRRHHKGRQNANQALRRKVEESVSRENPRVRELIPYK